MSPIVTVGTVAVSCVTRGDLGVFWVLQELCRASGGHRALIVWRGEWREAGCPLTGAGDSSVPAQCEGQECY